MLRPGSRRAALVTLVLAISSAEVIASSTGFAQPADTEKTAEEKAAALKAFEDGLAAEKNGDFALALEKFQKVGAFKMTPHVRFHMALCEEKLGKLVSALRGFELAEAEAIKMGKDAQVVADKAPARIEALRKRVASVRIEVKGTVLYSRVVIDGEPVLAKDFGSLISLDPGAHVIGVETDGALAQKREVTLAEKGYETITFEIQDKERPVATATATSTATVTAPPPPPPPLPSRLPAFVLGGAGIASLIGAGVFYGLRSGALDSFAEQCPVSKYPVDRSGVQHCPVGAQGARDDAQTFTLGAGVMLGLGVAALGGAGAYWFLTQRRPAAPPAASIGVSVVPGGVKVIGSF